MPVQLPAILFRYSALLLKCVIFAMFCAAVVLVSTSLFLGSASDSPQDKTKATSALSPPKKEDKDSLPPPKKEEKDALPPPRKEEKDALPPPKKEEKDALPPPKKEDKDALPPPKKEEKDALPPPRKEEKDALPPPKKEVKDDLPPPKKEEKNDKDKTKPTSFGPPKSTTNMYAPQSSTVNPHPFQFLLNEEDICSRKRKDIFIISVVHTAPKNYKRRMLIRETYGSQEIYGHTKTTVIFAMGATGDQKVMQ